MFKNHDLSCMHRVIALVMSCIYSSQIQRSPSMMWEYAEYSTFSLDSETASYTLHVTGYTGDASDALASNGYFVFISNNCQFGTFDRDSTGHGCGSPPAGGWWYNWCSTSKLTLNLPLAFWTTSSNPPSVGDVLSARMMIKSIQ